MTDKQEHDDDICIISQQLRAITTVDPNLNINERSLNDSAAMTPKFKNSSSMNSIHEKRNKSCSVDDNYLEKGLPGTNLPEKIVFIVDTAREMDCTPFETRSGTKYPPFYMIKRVIEIFVTAKSGIQPKHEYALMTLKADSVTWVSNFTNNRKAFIASLAKIADDPVGDDQGPYNLGPCFEVICKNTVFNDSPNPSISVARAILVYSRSHSIPQFITGRKYFDRLIRRPHFYLDCLYVHEPLSTDNDCQNIYEKLSALDVNQTSYILEVGRNLASLHTNMAKLIAHPMQRSRQDNLPYTVYNAGSPQDVQTNV